MDKSVKIFKTRITDDFGTWEYEHAGPLRYSDNILSIKRLSDKYFSASNPDILEKY